MMTINGNSDDDGRDGVILMTPMKLMLVIAYLFTIVIAMNMIKVMTRQFNVY